jgi:hypothetical protein
MAVPAPDSLGSSVGKIESTDVFDRGKMTKQKKTPTVDSSLRDALSAVLSTTNLGTKPGSDPGSKSLQGVGLPDVIQRSEISTCRVKSGSAVPNPAVTSAERLDDEDPCLDASATFEPDKKDPIDQILQAIRDAGYTVKKDNKSLAGLGHTVNHSGSVTKKREEKACERAPDCKFVGRPCELKYGPFFIEADLYTKTLLGNT